METKQRIVDAAKERFLKYGVRSVTMDDIASELGMSKKTLYQSFANKEALVERVIVQLHTEEMTVINQISQTASNAVEEMIRMARFVVSIIRSLPPNMMYEMQKYYPKVWKVDLNLRDKECRDLFANNISKGIQEGYYRAAIRVEILSKLLLGGFRMLTDVDEFPEHQYPPDAVFEQFIFHYLHGIVSEKGLEKLQEYKELADFSTITNQDIKSYYNQI